MNKLNLEEFVIFFSDQFDDTDWELFAPELSFHDLEEWSSLVGLAVLNMITQKYMVRVSPNELTNTLTVKDLWELVQNKVENNQ